MRVKSSIAAAVLSLSLMILSSVGFAAASLESQVLDIDLKKASVKQISNVVYAQVPSRGYDNVALKMDILKPETKEKLPAVIYVTGGGFINANKDNFAQQRMEIAEAGYVVASIEYRVAPTAIFPEPLEDLKTAIRYLKANAEKFNINPDEIALMGSSAGGYLVAMAGTSNDTRQFDKGEHLDQTSNVQAVIDLFGLSDLTKVGDGLSEQIQQLHKSPAATESLWVNGSPVFTGVDATIHNVPEKAMKANPIHYIDENTPPFLLMHGDKDTVVSPKQTEILHKALVEKGIESTRYVVKNAKHGGQYWTQPEVVQTIIEFLDKHLKK